MSCQDYGYYKFSLRMLSLVGQSPYDSVLNTVFRNIVIVTSCLSVLATQIASLVNKNFGMQQLLISFPIMAYEITLIISSGIITLKNNMFNDIWEKISEDWQRERNEEEDKIKRRYAELGQVITKTAYCLIIISYVAFVIITTFCSKITGSLLPNNITFVQVFFFPENIFLHQTVHSYWLRALTDISTLIDMLYIFAGITNFCTFVLHFYGMCEVVMYRLENAVPHIYLNGDNFHLTNNLYHKSIVLCIERHQKILEFGSAIQTHYAPLIAICAISYILIATPSIVQLANIKNIEINAVVQIVLCIVCIFMTSTIGQKVIDYSGGIEESAYLGNWYLSSSQVQKLVKLIIMQSQRPCTISVSFFTLSHLGFGSIINSAISGLSVFYQTQ